MKVFTLLFLLTFIFSTGSVVLAEDICEEYINSVCIDCHNPDRVCEKLGATEKTWESLLDFMNANGAELEPEEMEALAKCLSEPSPGAKSACGK